jgi:hypothetical protein
MHEESTIKPEATDDAPIEIAYRTLVERERASALGRAASVVATRPALMGGLGGVFIVAAAAAARPAGVANAPEIAATLSAIVVATWATLIWVTRGFFEGLTRERVEVVRELILTDDHFEWATLGDGLVEIASPTLAVHAAPGAQDAPGERPWPVWLIVSGVASGEKPRWVLESKLMAREARALPEADPRLFEARDEVLPTHVASPLLRRAMGAA